ncbi:uncharacterized protein LOC128546730 [Mercenaria mercenaria]|uniref:uncharacterized protein LOC128546730 n=1 Tax=Mercenaria mercenaria TaxID=6596 RepID=UPI00234E79BE|nr:uncharacterized protein LOC128546730 [Mercenaria mercenaria]
MSQSSATSTVPYELTDFQDQDFIEELNEVDNLYFNDRILTPQSNQQNPSVLCSPTGDTSDEESDINYDSDIDDDSEHVPLEFNEADFKEYNCQAQFKTNTCGCKSFYRKPRSTVVDFDFLIELRENYKELSRDELGIALKSELLGHRHSDSLTDGKKHVKKERERPYQEFYLSGKRVCRATFCFAHGIDKKKLQAVGRSLDVDGFKPRIHGRKGVQPSHSLTFEDRERIKTFICRYARDNGLPLPGRLPNFKESHVLILPSDNTVSDIHQKYEKLATQLQYRTVSLRTIQRTWHDLCPYINVCKPCTDICQQCQKFSYEISNSGNLPEEEKTALLVEYQAHLNAAKQQREYYRQQCMDSKLNYSLLPPEYKSDGEIHE